MFSVLYVSEVLDGFLFGQLVDTSELNNLEREGLMVVHPNHLKGDHKKRDIVTIFKLIKGYFRNNFEKSSF